MLTDVDRKTMRALHEKRWMLGEPGKFLVTPAGTVVAWTYDDCDDFPIHGDVRKAFRVEYEAAYGYVEPDGRVSEWYGPRDHEEKLYRQLGLPTPALV